MQEKRKINLRRLITVKMKDGTEFILIFAILICSFILGWCVNSLRTENMQYKIPTTANSEVSNNIVNVSQCAGMNLKNTSYCLVNYVKIFYNYTVRTDVLRTEEDIRVNGGDCFDYTHLYMEYAKSLNFNAYNETFLVTNSTAHTFAVLTDKGGYCILDQLSYPSCYVYGR